MGSGDESILGMLAREAFDFDLDDRDDGAEPLADEHARAYLADPNVVHWIAESEGKVLGHLHCVVTRQRAGDEPFELALYEVGVRKAARRRGIGRALVDTMRAFMRERGICYVWLLADNAEAIEFYRVCGFEAGNAEAAVYMAARVDPTH